MEIQLRLLALLFVFILMNSCSTPRPKGSTEAEILYQEAQELMESGRFILATEKLNRIRSKFPYSYYATFAELLGADVLFKQENYAEAAAAYIVFKDFHPRHKKADYVLWMIGESFYKQTPDTHDRDLSPAFEAIKYYQELQKVFPASDKIEVSRERIAECKKMIRDKEKYIADFYFKTEVYDAARFRYKNIIQEFNEPELRAHAMLRAMESSIELRDPKFCREHKEIYVNLIDEKYKNELNEAYSSCLSSVE